MRAINVRHEPAFGNGPPESFKRHRCAPRRRTLTRVNLNELSEFLAQQDVHASATLDALTAFEATEWVTVYRDRKVGDTEELRLAVLLQGDEPERAHDQAGFDFSAGDGRPGFVTWYDNGDSHTEYTAVGAGDVVPLVHVRYHDGDYPKTVELSEDFRLCWNLYEDRNRQEFLTTDEVGDPVVVAAWRNGDLVVHKKYLRRYQAARRLHLSIQVVADRRGGDELNDEASASSRRPQSSRAACRRMASPPNMRRS